MRAKKNTAFLVQISFALSLVIAFTSCGSSRISARDYTYFQYGLDTVVIEQKETKIQANDLLSIQVFSKTLNQEQAAIFNLPGTGGNNSTGTTQGYQVGIAGTVDMPVIGSVKAGGLTKEQLQSLLVQKLSDYVKNPSVLVKFLQFNVNVLGEVHSPGTQKFFVDRVTIIDALSAAGDLTDFGKRQDVTVIREEGNRRIYRVIDLREKNLFTSPVYLLKPNDIVYVAPNKSKLRSLSADPEKQRRTGLFFSIVSILLTAASVVIFATRN